ncbi:hypothetical protein [Argonema antarcticum]|uniref:hypothetical protein n=1 Tax=Argonema antarcticum TaxID=2942763 RepID=UPI002011AF8A|nr:hypothetical protein [Argonema antarcticum]MCL1472521.1 hypothetical protein [Argonema antarcticum A004/B2]
MIQPKPSDREDSTPLLEASTQLELTEVEVLPSQSTRTKIRKPRNLPRTEPPLFSTKSMEMMLKLSLLIPIFRIPHAAK